MTYGRKIVQSVIVVGAGNWGKNLIANFHALDALAGVVEVDSTLRQRVENNYPDLAIYTDFQQALIETSATGIVIATPAPTHSELAMRALAAGKDVFVEKPMTLTMAEAQALAEYADSSDRVLMVYYYINPRSRGCTITLPLEIWVMCAELSLTGRNWAKSDRPKMSGGRFHPMMFR
jgi:Oxidoreductase family, NAD-binding Rossmann fold